MCIISIVICSAPAVTEYEEIRGKSVKYKETLNVHYEAVSNDLRRCVKNIVQMQLKHKKLSKTLVTKTIGFYSVNLSEHLITTIILAL